MLKLYRTRTGIVADVDGDRRVIETASWDEIVNAADASALIRELAEDGESIHGVPPQSELLPPIGSQEVWAAGVTYYRSRDARMEEAKSAGGQDFYSRVYSAERPELFFKAPPYRVVGPGAEVRIRRDSRWNVPEPELTLVINNRGLIVGYTIGNDMSSRDIEGENPLYLPQAKVYDGSCAIGPCMLLGELNRTLAITLSISRQGAELYRGATDLTQLKRAPEELAEYLYRETSFPTGALLLTGTGIVPGSDFTLLSGDEVSITIEPIGTLVNRVA